MTINFIPNDPLAAKPAPTIRATAKFANRPASRASFSMTNGIAEGVAPPGTPQFLHWQCRQAAIGALRAWEDFAGPHTKWQGNRKRLPLLPDAGLDLNAFYDRDSVSFFHQAVNGKTYFSGASTDVVSHEVGHGLLDSLRPDLWDINFLEVGAFHEAFGDCIALLTALSDADSCAQLLKAAPKLRKKNFLEATAEELSKAISLIDPNHNAAVPRHAFNKLQYQIPSTLPDDGGPGVLINEVHSFGMIFTGCFWDLIANLFAAGPKQDAPSLAKAAKTAGALLVDGAKAAVVTPRFIESVGRAMVMADEANNAGKNRELIKDAFKRHGILLATHAMLAPTMTLAADAPKARGLTPSVTKAILGRLGNTNGSKMAVSNHDVFGTPVATAVHTRDVDLGKLGAAMKGVVAHGHEPVVIGASGGKAAILGALPNAIDTESEVLSFVQSLLAHGEVEAGGEAKSKGMVAMKGVRAAKPKASTLGTHTIATEGGKKVLKRIRFQCLCCR